jgi:hypothetical protein
VDASTKPLAGIVDHTRTRRFGSGYGSGLTTTAYMTLNNAVVAPMPSARVRTATSVNWGAARIVRTAYATS